MDLLYVFGIWGCVRDGVGSHMAATGLGPPVVFLLVVLGGSSVVVLCAFVVSYKCMWCLFCHCLFLISPSFGSSRDCGIFWLSSLIFFK